MYNEIANDQAQFAKIDWRSLFYARYLVHLQLKVVIFRLGLLRRDRFHRSLFELRETAELRHNQDFPRLPYVYISYTIHQEK